MRERIGAGRLSTEADAGRDDPARRLAAALGRALAAERERWVLWCPVAFGVGIGGYFALPAEPPIWLGSAGVAFALLLALAGRLTERILLAALALALLAGGFAAAQLRTQMVAAPILAEEVWGVGVIARVAAVEPRETGVRLVLAGPEIEGLAPEQTPATVRVTVAAGAPGVAPGDRVQATAVLRPPPEPVAPGAYDFARDFFFRGIGAVGFVLGGVTPLPGPPGDGPSAWTLAWSELRHDVAGRVQAALPGATGAVAAALMTGERGAVPEAMMEDLRVAGLAHLLAISGLHIGLVAGLVFFAVRLGLAAIPALALRWPIKKWAAAAALLAAGAYLMLVGATVPAQRAFLMTAIVLLGVALDRTAVSLRLVAWAALAVLLLHPESLTGVSFQMSFAATTALVACYEALRARAPAPGSRSWPRRLAWYFASVALTSLVAGAATAPFALYHFNRVALFGLAANMAAVPLVGFWVMPLALAAFALMPLGAESLALTPMGWGLSAVLAVASEVAAWPGAALRLVTPPLAALLLVVVGGLWLCLWRRRWRLWGLAGIAIGLATLPLSSVPDVLVGREGDLLAVRGADGRLWLSTDRRAQFSAEFWLRRAGQREDGAPTFPRAGPADGAALACDPLGCIYRRAGHVVALVRDARALREDCARASVLVATVPVRRHDCAAPLVVVDRFDIWRSGGHALHLTPEGVRVESVRDRRGRRPWVRSPPDPSS